MRDKTKTELRLSQRERGYVLAGHNCFNCRFVRLTPGELYLEEPKCSCSYDGKRVLAMACCNAWEPKRKNQKMNNLPLARAIWKSGFRAGLDNGRENAIARMNGKENEVTEDAEEAWVDYVEWKLEGTPELDPEDPKSWNNIP